MLQTIDVHFSADEILQSLNLLNMQQDQYDDMSKLDINSPTNNFFYDPWQLKSEFATPKIIQLFDQLGPIGQAKIVIIKPGQSYMAHADVEDRYHITLQSDQSYLIDLKHNQMYATQVNNKCYLMNTDRIHTAANFGYKDRIQLVIRKLLIHHPLKNSCHVHIKPAVLDEPFNQRRLFDEHILCWLNLANKRRIIDNFNPMGEDVELQFDLEQHYVPELQQQIAQCGFDILCDIT